MDPNDTHEPLAVDEGAEADELQTALGQSRRRQGPATSTVVLGAIVLLAVGFLGGLIVGRNTAPETSAAAGFPDAFPTPGGGAPGVGGAGGFTVGTVAGVDGDVLTVETQDGDTIEVVVGDDTDIRITEEGTLDDLAKGSTVVVQGDEAEDGRIEASSINEGGLGGLGEAFGGPSLGS